jgi:predicted sulfurtransferase
MTGSAGRRAPRRRLQERLPMLTRVCLVVALVSAVCVSISGQVTDETAIPRIALADLKKAVDAGQVLVVDVRDAGSYAGGHLPGAISIPLDALQQKLAVLKGSKKPIVTYCA